MMLPSIPTLDGASKSRRRWWPWLLVVIVALAIASAIIFRPHAKLEPSREALAQVHMTGLDPHLERATYTVGGRGRRALRIERGQLWPTQTLPAGVRVDIRLAMSGIPGIPATVQNFSVTTPSVPQLAQGHVSVNINHRIRVPFKNSVAQLEILGSSLRVRGGLPASQVAVGSALTLPSQHGTLRIRARARQWEAMGPVETVRWASVPWLRVQVSHKTPSGTVPSLAPITVTFASPVRHAQVSTWSLAPKVTGHWKNESPVTWVFQPQGSGFAPGTPVSLTIPGQHGGPMAADGASLQSTVNSRWTTPAGSTLRLQEWLAELGYLPVSWTAGASGSSTTGWSSAYQPPQGSFSWRYGNVPASLKALWNPGTWTVMTQGAVIAFERQHGMTVDGIAGPKVWEAIRHAVRHHDVTTVPYSYVYVSETLPERLWLWVGGRQVLTTLANTGIPSTPTYRGTYPVYLRLPFQVMRGKNPDGTKYADPVYWINYFQGSDAVHGFVRAKYGFPQSLGCVEVPPAVAKKIYPHLYLGSLVTVAPPGSGPI